MSLSKETYDHNRTCFINTCGLRMVLRGSIAAMVGLEPAALRALTQYFNHETITTHIVIKKEHLFINLYNIPEI